MFSINVILKNYCFSKLSNLRGSMLPGKAEQMMFLWLNRFFIPEIRALDEAKQEKKGAAAKSADKVAAVQKAAEGSQVADAL